MKRNWFTSLAAAAIVLYSASVAAAATVTFTTTNDGTVQDTSGSVIAGDAAQTITATTAGGGTKSVLIFEFDMSSIDDMSSINSATFSFVTSSTPVSSVSSTVLFTVDFYAGNGAVDVDDFTAIALSTDAGNAQGFLSTTPSVAGTVIDVSLTDQAALEGLLTTDFVTFRLEVPGLFQQVQVASLENNIWGPATLTLDATLAPPPGVVPLPASLPLLLAGLGAIGFVRRRTR